MENYEWKDNNNFSNKIKKRYYSPIIETNVLMLEYCIAASSAKVSPGENNSSGFIKETYEEETIDVTYEW